MKDNYWLEIANLLILEECEHDYIVDIQQDEDYVYKFNFELGSGIYGIVDCWDREVLTFGHILAQDNI